MSTSPVRLWLVAAAMLVGTYVDTGMIHLTVLSVVVLVLCAVYANVAWRTGKRMAAFISCLIGFAGFTYALSDMSRCFSADSALGYAVACSVHSYARDFGHAPERLENLVPEYLPALPRARSPMVGKITYSRISEAEWCVVWRSAAVCSRHFNEKDCHRKQTSTETKKPGR